MKKLSKTEAKEQVEEFFSDIKNKNSGDIKKIKKLAMRHNIKLGKKKRLFCRKCFSPYKNSKIRIRNNMKRIECRDCGYISRMKL